MEWRPSVSVTTVQHSGATESELVASTTHCQAFVEPKRAAITRYTRTPSDSVDFSVVKRFGCYFLYLQLTVRDNHAVLRAMVNEGIQSLVPT